MRLIKVFSCGKVLKNDLYERLKVLDLERVFSGCGNEFFNNRDWWVAIHKKTIVAYCGCLYSEGICIFVRAWVHKGYRGFGVQRQMIQTRLRAAAVKKCKTVITYTTYDNTHSANNLIKTGFLLYDPWYRWAGDMLYWKMS